MINLFASAILGIAILGSGVNAVPAQQIQKVAENNKISQLYSDNELNAQNSNNGENYNYSKAIAPKFKIEDALGTILISEQVILSFENEEIAVPNFNYYRIIDKNNETRFYIADTAEDKEMQSNFAYIGIFLPSAEINEENIVMNFQYGVAETMTLKNVKVVLSESELAYFDSIAQPLVLGNDELSQRLKASGKAFQYGAYEEQLINQESNIQPMTMNSIKANSYDSYTDSDGIILSYEDSYFHNCTLADKYTITDDPIVQIVPKDLCFIPGEHLYIGKEYGFFIKVVPDHIVSADYAADVFVFDIANEVPSFPSNVTGSAKVRPLFQYRYRAADRYSRNDWSGMDPSLTRVVFPHTECHFAEYYMNDIGFRHSLFNPTQLNPGDTGYDPYEDDGAFIIQMRYNSRGVGLKKKGGSFAKDTIEFGLGYIPIVGSALNLYTYAYNLHSGFGNSNNYSYTQKTTIADNEANIYTYETNNTDQIKARGHLIKSETATQRGDEKSPRLINVGGGYAESKYVVARRSGSDYKMVHVVTSISANILEDNTDRWWLFGWHENGSTVNYGRATGTYEVSNYERIEDVDESGIDSIYMLKDSGHKILKFVPLISGQYRMETISGYGDPNFSITDATTKTCTYAIDDINGAQNRNARLDIYLNAGHVYYIDAFRYNSSYSYTLRIGFFTENAPAISLNVAAECNVEEKTYMMFKFVPQTTGHYNIFTSAHSGDPYLYLFDADGNKLTEDDDGWNEGDYDSLIRIYLYADKTYYIAVQGYRGNNAVYGTLNVTPA